MINYKTFQQRSYRNSYKWIKNLLILTLEVSVDKEIRQNFNLDSGNAEITKRQVLIQSQIIIKCVESLM